MMWFSLKPKIRVWEGVRGTRRDHVRLGLSLKVQEAGTLIVEGRTRWIFQLKQKEWIHFCSGILFDVVPQWTGWCPPTLVGWSLLSLLIQMLISSRNTFTDTLRNDVLPGFCASHSPVKWTHKINCHRNAFRKVLSVETSIQITFSFNHLRTTWD